MPEGGFKATIDGDFFQVAEIPEVGCLGILLIFGTLFIEFGNARGGAAIIGGDAELFIGYDMLHTCQHFVLWGYILEIINVNRERLGLGAYKLLNRTIVFEFRDKMLD